MPILEPSKKSPLIDLFLSHVSGKSRELTIASKECMTCNNANVIFKDALSEKEYTISGMCQECQDYAFNPKNSEELFGE